MTRRLVSMFLFLSVLWGFSFPAISVGLEFIPPILFAAFRYDVAAVILLGYTSFCADARLPEGRDNLVAVLGGGVFLVAGNGLLFVGQQTVPGGVAAILQALVPIVTALWAMLLLGERLSTMGALGVAVGFLGIVLVVQPDPSNMLAGDTAGRLTIVGQVISVALGSVIIQHAEPTVGRVPLTGWAMLVGAVLLHVFSVAAGETPTQEVATPTAVGSVAYLGVFSTALAFFIYFTILAEHGAFEASLVAYLVPVVATAAGVLVLDETVGAPAFAGFGLVAVGFAFLKRGAVVELLRTGVRAGQ
jgi:drug/metabolite transporter (DMT)-like permease